MAAEEKVEVISQKMHGLHYTTIKKQEQQGVQREV